MRLPACPSRARVTIMVLAAASVLLTDGLQAQDAAPTQVAVSAATPTTPVTIADLVAPIALYPDQLLGQVLTISSTPQEVLDLGNWLIENDTLTGSKAQDAAKEAGFSTSAQYLALFPQVVDNMAQEIDWTTQLGDAFIDKPKDVMAAIQAKRVAAEKAGNLKTSSQMTVETKKADDGTSYITIAPTDPKVIYVPVYNPVNVYVTNPTPAAAPVQTTTTTTSSSGVSTGAAVGIGLLSFGVGMVVGSAIHTNYYPYPMWGYGGMYYGGHPYYPPPYRPPYYPGYRPAYGYHPPSSYHWNQVNRQTNVTINNNNYYNKVNNNPRKPSGNANRPGQVAGGNRPGGGGGEYKGARPGGNDRPGAGNDRPGAGNNRPGGGNDRPGADNNRPGGGTDRPAVANAGGAGGRPGGSGAGDRGYGGGAGGAANRPAPAKPAAAPQANRSGGAFGSAGGGSGSSARAASDRGRASTGAPARGGGGGGGGGGGNRGGGGGGGGRKR